MKKKLKEFLVKSSRKIVWYSSSSLLLVLRDFPGLHLGAQSLE